MRYEVKLILTTDSILEPEQIVGEAFDDYKENYKIQNLSVFVTEIKPVK